jgi:spermidine synthase
MRWLLLFSISLSGFSALTYEILWTRHLSLVFGTTMAAVSMVTAAFMAGLGLGSRFFGRLADRHSNPLLIFALLELGLAFYALAFPYALGLIEKIYLAVFSSAPDAGVGLLRLAMGALLLVPPALLMGGTLPVLSRYFYGENFGTRVGRLYFLNTLGAVLGCLGAAYWLIPHLGLSGTAYAASAGNLLIAASLLPFAIFHRPNKEKDPFYPPPPPTKSTESFSPPFFPLIIAGASGFLALGLEILWTRLFILYLGSTSFSFALVLGVFLTGLALGGGIYSALRPDDKTRSLLAILLVLCLFLSATIPFYDRMGHLFFSIYSRASDSWALLCGLSYLGISLVLLVPTMCSGALLPLTIDLLGAPQRDCAKAVGRTLFSNTVGAIAGSLAASFLLLPRFGLQFSFQILGLTGCVLALTAVLVYRSRLNPKVGLAILIAPMLLLALPSRWDAKVLNAGPYYYAAAASGHTPSLESLDAGKTLLAIFEGRETTVAVYGFGENDRLFRVNGKTDGSTYRQDMPTQILLGQLPLFLNPEAERVLVIGLGTGITLGNVLTHPVAEVDCAEISPEVVSASRFFEGYNHRALADPRTTLIIDDARNHLLTKNKRYDAIISEPSNPWQSGNANLFTREFYRLVRDRLSPDGVFCQWFPLYDLDTAKVRSAASTLLDTFPYLLAFRSEGDLILLGSRTARNFSYPELTERFASDLIREALLSAGIDAPEGLFAGYYTAGTEELLAFAKGAPLNTDNNPLLEFTPQLGKNRAADNLTALNRARAQSGRSGLPLDFPPATHSESTSIYNRFAQQFLKAGRMPEATHFLRLIKAEESH